MIDHQMKKSDLFRVAEISGYTATKLNKDEPVSLEVLLRICKVFHCDIGDVVEFENGVFATQIDQSVAREIMMDM